MTTKHAAPPREPSWLELSNMTDKDLAALWREWDAYATDLATSLPVPRQSHAARKVADTIQAYAGQRLISRSL